MNPTDRLNAFVLRRSEAARDMFLLAVDDASTEDGDGADIRALTEADLRTLRQLIDEVLPPQAHNHQPADPEAHVVFGSVCCPAQLYRCPVLVAGRPSKPIISAGETSCRQCGTTLTEEAF